MEEQNNNKLHIHLHVYDEEITVMIDREEEEYYRAAAKQVTDRYNVYAKLYKGRKSEHTVSLMTLIDVALQYQKELAKNDTAPYNDVLKTLTAEIEQALGESE